MKFSQHKRNPSIKSHGSADSSDKIQYLENELAQRKDLILKLQENVLKRSSSIQFEPDQAPQQSSLKPLLFGFKNKQWTSIISSIIFINIYTY